MLRDRSVETGSPGTSAVVASSVQRVDHRHVLRRSMMPVSIVRRHAFKALAAATVLTFGSLVVPLVMAAAAPAPAATVLPASARSVAHQDSTRVELVASGSEARYRAQEQLAGRGFNEAVGRTSGVQGAIVLGADGSVLADESKIIVDLSTL